MTYFANEISALIAVPLLALSLRGFLPPAWRQWRRREWDDSGFWVGLVVIGSNALLLARTAYWDAWRPLLRYLETGEYGAIGGTGALVNAAFNIGGAALAVMSLAVLYFSIPRESRSGWSILSAPFYPNGYCILRVRREK